MADDDHNGFVFYRYKPSIVAAALFTVLFFLSAIHHTIVLVRRRAWYFIPFLIGCLFEAVGYIGRIMSSNESPDFTLGPYIIQSLLILLAPALFAASIYMLLGRTVLLLDAPQHSLIRPRFMTKVFVAGDVLSFLVQSGGGGYLASSKDPDGVQLGENMILGGLGIQILFFGFFIVCILVFDLRVRRDPPPSVRDGAPTARVPWRGLLWVLYATSLLIFVRSIFRIAEYVQGQDGVLQSKEAYIYVFDATLMFLVVALFNAFHPSRVLGRRAIQAHSLTSAEVLRESHLLEDARPRKDLPDGERGSAPAYQWRED